MLSNKQSVRDLIHLLVHHGVRRVVVSPGSRNAPLSVSLDRHPEVETHVVIDERSAAFVALGMAQQSGEPVAICCTSGSAAYNYAPAVAEAYFQRIPLVVLTADRPEEWIGQGDGQTIFQSGIFGPHVRAAVDVREDIAHPDQRLHQWRSVHNALLSMRDGADGPVHFNVFLREPLYEVSDRDLPALRTPTPPPALTSLPANQSQALNNRCAAAKSVLILAGSQPPDAPLQQDLERLSALSNVLVLTEHHSNLAHERFVGCIDRLLMTFADGERDGFVPEVLITFGTNIISKKIKALFREDPPAEHWHVDPITPQMDTYASLTRAFRMQPHHFFAELDWSSQAEYAQPWQARNGANQTHHNAYVAQAGFSDMQVIQAVHRSIPAGSMLHMGNSAVVRYFLLDKPRTDLHYFGNRGTSGIDGCTSTAVGANAVTTAQMWLVSGDVAFFYDSNAFWNDQPKDGLKVVVVNNQGGGIFRIIPGPEQSGVMERYFESHHLRTAQALVTDLGLAYQSAGSNDELRAGLAWLEAENGPAVLEVFTPRSTNAEVLKAYFAALKTQAHG